MSAFHQWLSDAGLSSSWVQAWGTLIALGIAIWIPQRQHQRDRKLDLINRGQYMAAIRAISSEALQHAEYAISDMSSDSVRYHDISTGELGNSRQVLDTVTLETLPDEQAFMAVYQLRRELANILFIAKNAAESLSPQGVNPESLNSVMEAMKNARKAFETLSLAIEKIEKRV